MLQNLLKVDIDAPARAYTAEKYIATLFLNPPS